MSITNSWSLLKLMSIVWVMPYNRLILCRHLLLLPSIFPRIRVGEGNGTSLQYSCLENPRDRGAWWAAVYGVAQSWTQLKRLSSSSSSVFSNESVLHIRWPKYWSFSFSISPSNEYSGLISFRMDWLNLLAVQGILKSLLQYLFQKHDFLGAQLSL